jgi:hypothetical protein
MSGLALPRSNPSGSSSNGNGNGNHTSINPSALSRPPRVPGDELKEIKQSASGSGSGSGKEKPVLTNVPEITVVEGLVPTLQ